MTVFQSFLYKALNHNIEAKRQPNPTPSRCQNSTKKYDIRKTLLPHPFDLY